MSARGDPPAGQGQGTSLNLLEAFPSGSDLQLVTSVLFPFGDANAIIWAPQETSSLTGQT
jgi:hypothetical protein